MLSIRKVFANIRSNIMNQDVGLNNNNNKINLLNVAWISPEINPRHSFHDGIADTLQKVVGGLAYGT